MKIFLFFIIFYSISTSAKRHRHNDESQEDYEDEDLEVKTNDIDKAEEFPDYIKVCSFVGTNLFGDGTSQCSKLCLPNEKIALLRARREFEYLLPKDLPKTLVDDNLVTSMMHYFYGANQVILRMCSGNLKIITEKAFYDALGGYLHWYLLPVMKTSFYAGLICLKTAQSVIELYRQCKINLNTNGNLWRAPIVDFTEFDIQIEPIQIFQNVDQDETSCIHLELSDDRSENDDDMIVSMPKLDVEENGLLTNIWLPFKRKKSFNLRSIYSAFIFLKYFETVSRCYKFEGICQKGFNSRLKDWLQENIENHLGDDILYPGLGAISRVLQTVRLNKEIMKSSDENKSKRQDTPDEGLTKRHKTPEFTKISTKARKLEGKKHRNDFIDELFRSKSTRAQLRDEEYYEIKNDKKKDSLTEETEVNLSMILLVGGIALSSSAFIALFLMMVTSTKENADVPKPKHSIISCFGLCSRSKPMEEDELPLIEANVKKDKSQDKTDASKMKEEQTKDKRKDTKSKPYTGEKRVHKEHGVWSSTDTDEPISCSPKSWRKKSSTKPEKEPQKKTKEKK